jgi:hypothetical protein
MRAPSILLILAASCTLPHDGDELYTRPPPVQAGPAQAQAVVVIPDAYEHAPDASPRRDDADLPADTGDKIVSYFDSFGSRRVHVQLDRPMYRPGDTVWIKTWSLVSRGLTADNNYAITYELLDPRGLVVETKSVGQAQGAATNDFVLDASVPGGQWTLRATLPTGEIDERHFIVSSYQTPRLRKTLDFVREAYGPGDRVEALIEIERTTGGPLADHPVHALVQIAGETVFETDLQTDETGAVFIAAQLAESLQSSDGMLTLLVEDGGVTESISRSIPLVLADVSIDFFPEGGDLVRDLPGRVYFEATDVHGEPADISGVIRDDRGEEVATFSSLHDGLGRFAFTPERGRLYSAQVTEPAGIPQAFALPHALADGCTLRSFDDVNSEQAATRVAIRCASASEVLVSGVLRERLVDQAAVSVGPNADTIVYLQGEADVQDEQGAMRVTVFDRDLNAIAERLVYRNAGRDLGIELTLDRDEYGPRDEVVVSVKTTNADGSPVAAQVALSVVDDALISMADDEEGHILSRLYLDPDLVESPDDPAWYFDEEEALAAHGLDLVMGTKGYRRFEWERVWNPPAPPRFTGSTATRARRDGVLEGRFGGGDHLDAPLPMVALGGLGMAEMHEDMDVTGELVLIQDIRGHDREARPQGEARNAGFGNETGLLVFAADDMMLDQIGYIDGEFGGGFGNNFRGIQTSTVRVFPKPDYSTGFTGTRTDFRDTVHWEPTLQTDENGEAEVRFYLSDAVTQFRLISEGVGAGAAGHTEATLASVLPVSIATTLPTQVSAGDTLYLPMTVSNARDQALTSKVMASITSSLIQATSGSGDLSVDAQGSATHWVELNIGQGRETATIELAAHGGGVTDTMIRTLDIVPPGFPRSESEAGEMDSETILTVNVDEWVEGSLTANISWQPSTAATLMTGMEGLIRAPGGCFEQTSSTNWPNVAILKYLEAHDGNPRLRAQSSQALDAGYAKLTGYQVSAGGFETWGTGPGKEALSAFGLLQFADMKAVYPVDDSVLEKDAEYLLAQRDGDGGFKNSGASAHGYGSAPPAVLNGFITWALVSTGHSDALSDEIAHQANVAIQSDDPYVLALAVRTLVATGHAGADRATERLAGLQEDDGSFPGAVSSITQSYEANLLVESTALAALALMEAGADRGVYDTAAEWLVDNRRGTGTWGATQATALALSALTKHADVSRRPKTGGRITVEVNGHDVGAVTYNADQTEPLSIDGWKQHVVRGENTIVLRQASGEPLPYTVDVSWTSVTPHTSPGAELTLETSLSDTQVSMGETVRLTATLDNQAGRIVPSPIARIGLPAGLTAQTWQLQELQDRGEIAFFETRPREVTLYWDGLHADSAHEVNLDLVATVPGVFTGPASSAYPYYNDDEMAWQPGLVVTVDR